MSAKTDARDKWVAECVRAMHESKGHFKNKDSPNRQAFSVRRIAQISGVGLSATYQSLARLEARGIVQMHGWWGRAQQFAHRDEIKRYHRACDRAEAKRLRGVYRSTHILRREAIDRFLVVSRRINGLWDELKSAKQFVPLGELMAAIDDLENAIERHQRSRENKP